MPKFTRMAAALGLSLLIAIPLVSTAAQANEQDRQQRIAAREQARQQRVQAREQARQQRMTARQHHNP